MRLIAIGLMFLCSSCQTLPELEFTCVRGVVFVRSEEGLAWLPDLQGKPVSCVEWGGIPDDIPADP